MMILRNRFVWPPLVVVLAALALAQIPIPAWTISADDAASIARAYRTLTGRDVDPQWVCGRAAPDFPDVIALGEFAYDRGCAVIGVVVASRPLDLARGTAAGLARAGWASAPPAERARLALAWTRSVLLAYRPALDAAPEAFGRPDAPAFAPPSTEALPDGGVRVTLWVSEPSGMLPQSVFSRRAFIFSPTGAETDEQRLDDFTAGLRPNKS
jgi:hypothetical protein